MSNWNHYEAFVRVVDAGSFSMAAKQMNVSKSLLSRRISELEGDFGTQLLFRTTRRVTPTDAGYLFFERCQHILGQIEDARRLVSHMDVRTRGRLRIAGVDTFAERCIAPLAAQFMAQNPEIEIELHVTSRNVDLIAEGFDLAVRYGELSDSTLLAQKIFELPHVVAGSPAYLAAHGTPTQVEELHHHKCLVATLDACSVWEFNTPDKPVALKLAGNWCSNNGPSLIAAAISGLGLCRLPEIYVKKHIRSGELVPVLEAFRSPPLPVWAVYANHKHVAAKIRHFIRHLKTELPRSAKI